MCWRLPAPLGLVILKLDLPANDFAELLVGLRGLEPAVEVYGGLDVSVAQQALDDLIGTGMVAQIDRCSGVAELVSGDPQAGRVFNSLGYLAAEHVRCFRLSGHAWKQVCSVRSA